MTPRINESDFSEALLNQLKTKQNSYKLDGQGEITTLTHPAILKCELRFPESVKELPLKTEVHGYNLRLVPLSLVPPSSLIEGFPWRIAQFLKQKPSEIWLDFKKMGIVHLSTLEVFPGASSPELAHYTLPIWLDYALSPELWGSTGKWTRFHERLHTLFENNGLLIDQDFPGFYPLKLEAEWIEKYGFCGSKAQSSYNLIFPWDFPLSGLVELEKVLARGP